jgi:hypothetical protein
MERLGEQDMQDQEQELVDQEREHELVARAQADWEREQEQRRQEREHWSRQHEHEQREDTRQPLRIKKDFAGGLSCHQCKSRRNSGDLTYCTSSLRTNKVRTAVNACTFTLCLRK